MNIVVLVLCVFVGLLPCDAQDCDTQLVCQRLREVAEDACASHGVGEGDVIGPKGEKGDSGEAAVVDYVRIMEEVEEKYLQEIEALVMKDNEMKEKIESFNKSLVSLREKSQREITLLKIKDNQTMAMIKNLNESIAMLKEECDEEAENASSSTQTSTTRSMNCTTVDREMAKVWNGTGGVFDIYPTPFSEDGLEVYCDNGTDGGGWLVFQRRMDGSVNFYRNWDDYVEGFGEKDKEFWLGLENLHKLTTSGTYELRIDLQDWEGNTRYAKYSSFVVEDSTAKYRLDVGGYSGTAGDSMAEQNGMEFSTVDMDHDLSRRSCSEIFKGAWWYNTCHHSNLNGYYISGGTHSSYADGIEWKAWTGWYYSLKFTEMKIRLSR